MLWKQDLSFQLRDGTYGVEGVISAAMGTLTSMIATQRADIIPADNMNAPEGRSQRARCSRSQFLKDKVLVNAHSLTVPTLIIKGYKALSVSPTESLQRTSSTLVSEAVVHAVAGMSR